MDNKQKEQMKKGLVFGGLGLLLPFQCVHLRTFGQDKTAAEQGLK